MPNRVVGLDLGQAQDYTALVVVQGQVEAGRRLYEVPHIERWPLKTSYPAIARAVSERLRHPDLAGATLVVDGTGVGRAVTDLFKPLGRRLCPVTIHAGEQVTEAEGYTRVPKRDLVGCVQVALQEGRLKVASALPEADTLIRELLEFRVTLTDSGRDTYGAPDWRAGAHDDLVLALALALWKSEQVPKNPIAGLIACGSARGWGYGDSDGRRDRSVMTSNVPGASGTYPRRGRLF